MRVASIAGVGSLLALVASLLAATPWAGDDAHRPALTAADLDAANCASYHGTTRHAADEGTVAAALGLSNRGKPQWTAPPRKENEAEAAARFLITFRDEKTVGTILVPGGFQLRLLKPGHAGAPDPLADAAWVAPETPRSQSGGSLVPLPAGTRTRALLFTAAVGWGQPHDLRAVRVYVERLSNAVPFALAYADREYRPPNTNYNPWPASHVTTGRGHWVNVGKDQSGFIPAPPVTEINPSWFLLAWPTEQTIDGLWLLSNVEKYELATFAGPAGVNPRAGTPDEWRKVRDTTEAVIEAGERQNQRWIRFAQPLRTRGLRLTITRTSEVQVAIIKGFHAFTRLGDRPVPPAPAAADEPPPFRINYTLPEDGIVSMGVNAPDGRRVRNLTARATQKAGAHDAGWDLKDADGNYVAPGTYRWAALTGPELKAKYEMTVYPNVENHAPGNSPWLNGHDGPGGWMADHTPPSAGCAAGDKVFLGSQVAESGVSVIEVDTDGVKQWGHHSFAAWTGARFLASDGKEVFAGMPIVGTSTDAVWGIDLKTHKVRTVFQLSPSSSRARGMRGLAARDGKLYVAVKGTEAWLTGAAAGDDADLAACTPLYPQKRQPRIPYEVVPDPQGDFLKLFRLTGTPPGGSSGSSLERLETAAGAAARQHVVLAFKKPVPVGSAVLPLPPDPDVKVALSTLKANAPYPPNPDDDGQWQAWAGEAKRPWDVVAAPAGVSTRAVRLTFSKGGKPAADDPLASASEKPKAKDDFPDLSKPSQPGGGLLEFGGNARWKGRLDGLKLLRRRFENVAGDAAVKVSSGTVAADGTWDARRTTPLTEADPGVYLMEWNAAQTLRGLAIKEIDGELTKVDVFTGPAGAMPSLTGTDGWQTVAEYRQERREYYNPDVNHNSTARYIDGAVDFGKDVMTRAVRLRVVKQWADKGERGTVGVRRDQGGQTVDPTRCRVYGVAALKYVGGEPPVESASVERVDVHDAATGKVLSEIPLANPGEITFNPAGELHAIQGTRVVKVNPSGDHTPAATDLEAPTDLAFDKAGNVFVFDGGKARQNVRVYDPSGKFVRAVGTPGGFVTGPWDATRMGQVTAIDIDAKGQLWCVETQYHPKRVTVWNADGTFRKELLGNTPYGGGGSLDPADKTRLFHGPLEFEIDWATGKSRLKNITYLGSAPPGDVPVRANGRTYLVNRGHLHTIECGVVYRYENGRAIPAAAVGRASHFDPLKRPDVSAKFGTKALPDHRFIWTDRSGDGEVQADEVTLTPIGAFHSLTPFNRDLGVQGGTLRYEVKEFLPNGVPVYVEKEIPSLKGQLLYRLDNGTFYRMGSNGLQEGALKPDGAVMWSYSQEGNPGTHALEHAKPYTPDQIVSQFMMVGHETAPGGLGEFVVCNTNVGCWNVWSADGLLAGTLFRDFRSGRSRPWSMPDHARGTVWDDLSVGQEHFDGYLCKTADGKFYAVAGHNHSSVLEVLGLDQYKRLGGEVTVTADDIRNAREWETRRQSAAVYARAPVMDIHRLAKPPAFDGRLSGFGPAAARFDGPRENSRAEFFAGYDDTYLYLAYSTTGMGPLKNAGKEFERLFKTGAAVDLHLETDAKADPGRKAPAAGDVRLLLTHTPAGPRAVVYKPVVPGTLPEKAWRVVSPVGEVSIDEVKLLPGVRTARAGDADRYVLEAAVPLADLGLKPAPGVRVKLDWGVLVSGPDGTEVMKRVYWANQAAQIVADAPSEARLSPHLWGHAVFHGVRGEETRIDATSGPKKPDKDVSDILDDLKTTPKK